MLVVFVAGGIVEKKTLFGYGLALLSLLLIYLAYLVLKPFLVTILLTFILAYVFHPVYTWFLKSVKKKWLASAITIFIILVLIILPSGLFLTKLATEAAGTYRTFLDYDLKLEEMPFIRALPEENIVQLQGMIDSSLGDAKDYIVLAVPDVLGEVANIVLHLFIMFFILYFTFMDGARWFNDMRRAIPLEAKIKKSLFDDLQRMTRAIVNGQFLTAVIQGSLGGLMFFIFGIPNPVFWGFIMIICSFVPFLGTPIVFVPAAIIELVNRDYLAGIGILLVGFVVVMNVDNFLRPYLVGKMGRIHPTLVLVGVFGGLAAFGFSGMIIGPLILGLLTTVVRDLIRFEGDVVAVPVSAKPEKK